MSVLGDSRETGLWSISSERLKPPDICGFNAGAWKLLQLQISLCMQSLERALFFTRRRCQGSERESVAPALKARADRSGNCR